MKTFTKVTAKAVPLALNDVDTDLIIPAQYLTGVTREGYGRHLFERLRQTDPRFAFNLPRYQDAAILVANGNFGCGSSREHAVWALQDAGIKVVIAKSFADIFSGNAAKNGLLLVTLPAEAVDALRERAARDDGMITVDLEELCVSTPGGDQYTFSYDEFRRHCLLNGLDDLDYLLSKRSDIDRHRAARTGCKFFSTLEANR